MRIVSVIALVLVSLATLVGVVSPALAAPPEQDLSPGQITLLRGTVVSGDYLNLQAKDGSPYTLSSNGAYGYELTDWYTEFSIPSGKQATSLTVNYRGAYSAWRGQSVLAYDFVLAKWVPVNYTTIGPSFIDVKVGISANLANYVSTEGKIRIRVYTYSTAAFRGYADYLKLTAALEDVAAPVAAPVAPAPSPVTAPVVAPVAPVPAPVEKPKLEQNAYAPTNAVVTRGNLVSGSYLDLANQDGSTLVVKSENIGGNDSTDWYAEFSLPAGAEPVSVSLGYSGYYSGWRGQSILMFDYTTSTWRSVNYKTIGASVVTFEFSITDNPAKYVSPEGKVMVRVYAYSLAGFTAYTDWMQLSAK